MSEKVILNILEREIEVKILHILEIYPVISPTMLQGGLGPGVKSADWRPVLNSLLDRGIVVKSEVNKQTPVGRYNCYKRLSLANVEL